jgi:pyruvate dehydrogenase E2 component (dihydrolipoamide acetyltransferase)
VTTPVLMPKLGNSVESSIIVTWFKKTGETVQQGQVLCEIETDKATFEVQSPASGTLLETFYPEGEEVPVLTPIAVIGEVGAVYSPLTSQPVFLDVSLQTFAKAEAQTTTPRENRGFISPRAKKLALNHSLETTQIQGTGPNGRIIERDIQTSLGTRVTAPISSPIALPEGVTAIPLKGIRKRIADRMLESLQSTAQLTLNTSADARELQTYRKRLKTQAEKDSSLPNVTLNHLLMLVVARTLDKFPNINALLENDVLHQYQDIHLGFAVDTERGLLVPIIRNANRISLRELTIQAIRLAREAQDAKIAPDDLQGGTFTITNLGGFGIETFTPILNPPQIAILGIGNIQLKPVQLEENVEFIPHLNLSLTINHAVLDGAPASRFLQALCQNIANLSEFMLL